MGVLSRIAKSFSGEDKKKKSRQKAKADLLYKKRDQKLDEAIMMKKVTPKQKTALGKGGTKKYQKKFGPKVGVARAVQNVDKVDTILKDIRGG